MLNVEVIDTSELGDRSYVVHDGSTAVVIDPQRDTDRVESVLRDGDLTVAAVAETHIHNDYVTGGLTLARKSGADYLVCADDEVSFDRRPVSDGDVLTFGSLEVRVIATPGHTHTHLSYAVSAQDDPDARVAVFTGGSLLFGSVGRTDLLGDEHTDELTRAQFHSARKLAEELPEEADVFPTHGFGSFCSSGSAAGGDSSTIGEEKKRNDALTEDDEDAFVAQLVANLSAYPAYYAHMGALNLAGPGPADLSPPESVDAGELRRRIDAGEWVVDLRDKKVYPTGHVRGSIGIALAGPFATYVGWLMPWGTDLTLIGESEEQVADAQRELVRIGIDRPAGAAAGEVRRAGSRRRARRVPLGDLRGPQGEALRGVDGRGHGARRTARRRARRRRDPGLEPHPDPRAPRAPRRGPRGAVVGALRQRLPRFDLREPAGPRGPRRGGHRRRLRAGRRAGPDDLSGAGPVSSS